LGRPIIRLARESRWAGAAVRQLLGFRGTFSTLDDAAKSAARYVLVGHDYPSQHAFQATTRESDYPVLFFLSPIARELKTVFDLGGGIGNLFFVLDHHLHFSNDLVWKIHDLPTRKQSAIEFARLKNENRVVVVDDLAAGSGVDLFMVVGALHYFEQSLPAMIGSLNALPKHIIINRSPCSDELDIITVEDGGNVAIPCKIHNTIQLVLGMQELGYELVARWPAHERRFRVPLYPEYAEPYCGFYFRFESQKSQFLSARVLRFGM
jgi:putative methyltransferase (TIGR04325 family)